MNSTLLVVCVCWPLACAATLAARPLRGLARMLAPWAAAPALLAAGLYSGEFDLGWLMLGGHLGLDGIAKVLLPVTAGLWLAAGLFAQAYLADDPRRDVFFGWFLGAMAGNLLLLVALDAVVFYLGFALMSFASYGLVVHAGDARARHAGRYYIALVVIGEICVISALMLLASRAPIDFASLQASWVEQSGRNDLIAGLLLVGFGIKVGVVGLHFWLPLAHPVAPAPASAVLSGAMIKAGLVAWMRLLPLGEVALPEWGRGLALLGLATAFYGVVAGLPQREAKTLLAYSSVSQMGLMTMAVGLGLAFPAHWPVLSAAVLIYIAHHSLVKGALFMGAGLVRHGLTGPVARLAAVVLALAALSLAGGPMTGGLVAKLSLKQASALVDAPWPACLPWLLSLSSILTALLLLRFLWVARPRVSGSAAPLPPALVMPWLGLFLVSMAIPWWLAPPELRADGVSLVSAWAGSWPVLAAAAVAIIAFRAAAAGCLRATPHWPPGDLGIPLERGVLALGGMAGMIATRQIPKVRSGLLQMRARLIGTGPAWSGRVQRLDVRLRSWPATALLVLAVAAAIGWLLTRA
jgi:hydrogenase-4 component B